MTEVRAAGSQPGDVRSFPARWVVVAAALCVALCACYLVIHPIDYHGALRSDFQQYDAIARNILDGNGFRLFAQPAVKRAPGFPVWIAAIYALTDRSYAAVIFGQFLLVGLTVVCAARLAWKFAGRRASVVAAFVLAANPVVIHYAVRPYSEPLFTALSLVSFVILTESGRVPDRWRLLAGGAVAGLAMLVRPQMLLFPVFLGIWWIVRDRRARAFAATALVMVTMGIVVLPWAVRNYTVTGMFIPVQVQSGHVLWLSNNERVLTDPLMWGYNVVPKVALGDVDNYAAWSVKDQIARDDAERAAALEFLRTHLSDVPKLVAYKFARFLSLGTDVSLGRRIVLYVFDLSLVPLALVGTVLVWRSDPTLLGPTLAGLATTFTTVAIFWGDSRFRSTITPLFAALAAVALVEAWRFGRGRLKASRHGAR